jgi:hypothetical protein
VVMVRFPLFATPGTVYLCHGTLPLSSSSRSTPDGRISEETADERDAIRSLLTSAGGHTENVAFAISFRFKSGSQYFSGVFRRVQKST